MPTGIATDKSTKDFFADLIRRRSLVSLFDFENKDGIFVGVHRGFKFCLLTISGEGRRNTAAEFAFFLHEVRQLGDDTSRFQMDAHDFALFSPNTGNCPIFRSRRDMEISRKMYQRAGVLWQESKPGREEVNPWGIDFMQMFNMTTASHLFRTREQLEGEDWRLAGNIFERDGERCLPLYEAKMFDQYDHRLGTFADMPADARFKPKVRIPPISSSEKEDIHSVSIPRYWISDAAVFEKTSEFVTSNRGHKSKNLDKLVRFLDEVSSISSGTREHSQEFLQVFRDVTSATNERTSISGIVPICGIGHTATLVIYESAHSVASALVMANLNSIPFDWTARLSVGGLHLSYFIIKQLPVLPPDVHLEGALVGLRWAEFIIPRVLELTYTVHNLAGFACELGYEGPPFLWDDERRFLLRRELDAAFFHIYGLKRDDVDYILDTFPGVKRDDDNDYGEYRTKLVILEIYDDMANCMRNGVPYETRLSPPPADAAAAHAPDAQEMN